MTREEIIDRLRQTIETSAEEKINLDDVTTETAIADLGFDSLSILDLIYDVQQEFSLDFEAEKLVSVATVGDLTNFLEKELAD